MTKRIYVNGEFRTFSNARQEAFKPEILEACAALVNRQQEHVFEYVAQFHVFSAGDLSVGANGHHSMCTWQRICAEAASELRKDGWLEPANGKRNTHWTLTAKARTEKFVMPTEFEMNAAVSIPRAPAQPRVRYAGTTGAGRCLACFTVHEDGGSCAAE
jgi:hypothetical protein